MCAQILETPSTLGVADSDLYNLSDPQLRRQLQLLKEAGVSDLRTAVPWPYVQAGGPDGYDWEKMDRVVNTASAMGFNIVLSITGNPAWDGLPLSGAPDPTAYADFAGQVASRYRGRVAAYEVWNEPNGALFYTPVSPEGYSELLRAAYPAIKAGDPQAEVIGGVLGAVRTVPGATLAAPEFLERMYAAGAAGYFDALSYHPYHYGLPFSQGAEEPDAPLQQLQSLRALMSANGDGGKRIWATEYGNPTTPLTGTSDAQQAAFLHDFVVAWQEAPGAGPAFIYSTRDIATGSLSSEDNFGLWHSDGSPKQSADLLADLEQQLQAGALQPYTADRLPAALDVYQQVATSLLGLLSSTLLLLPEQAYRAAVNELPSLSSPFNDWV